MPSSPSTPTGGQPSNAGIITDAASGERHIPSSTRADGSTRAPIRIRPGYRPPEDVELYKNRTAEAFRERGRRVGIPGAAAAADDDKDQAQSGASNKNAKRREARKKAKAAGGPDEVAGEGEGKAEEAEVDPEVERQKKGRSLKKKLKQAKELKSKKEGGETLLPEQIAKVIKINELIRELDALGLDAEGEPKGEEKSTDSKEAKK